MEDEAYSGVSAFQLYFSPQAARRPCLLMSRSLLVPDALLGWRLAPTGYRFEVPHAVHVVTRISAQGFLPPRLLFSTYDVDVDPGMRRISQRLQIVCFSVEDSLIWLLRDAVRRWASKWRERAESLDIGSLPRMMLLFDSIDTAFEAAAARCCSARESFRLLHPSSRQDLLTYD